MVVLGVNSGAACFSHFHSRHCEINFFERRRRARIDAENGHRRVTKPRSRLTDNYKGDAGLFSRRVCEIWLAAEVHFSGRSSGVYAQVSPERSVRMGLLRPLVMPKTGVYCVGDRSGARPVQRGRNPLVFDLRACRALWPLTVQNYCNYLANFARFAVVLNRIGRCP